MRKSKWHRRVVVTSTAALMSVATALVVPQFSPTKFPIPEMTVPFHAAAPQASTTDHCDDLEGGSLNAIQAKNVVAVEIYSRDAAVTLPEISTRPLLREKCVSPDSNNLEYSVPRALTFVDGACEHGKAVAFNLE